MKKIQRTENTIGRSTGFAIDTTFVLFFLALEFGRSLPGFGFDSFLLGLTLSLLIAVPYFFINDGVNADFSGWLIGRGTIATFATALGWIFDQTLGVVLPEYLRFLPMTLLIVSAMIGCYTQFYGFLRLRPAK